MDRPEAGAGGDREALAREAARLRWELSRLRSRRAVRAALLAGRAGSGARGGPRDVLATLRGRRVVEDLDVIAPAVVRRRMAYPHLDVVHIGERPPYAAAAPHRRLRPDDPDAVRRQPPDLVVLDDLGALGAWPAHARTALRDGLAAAGAVVALVRDAAEASEAAAWPLDLLVRHPQAPGVPGTRELVALPGVDPARDRPVGWRRAPDRAAVALRPAAGGDHGLPVVDGVADAEAGAVLLDDVSGAAGAERAVRLAARGLPVVVPAATEVPEPLAPLVLRAPAGEAAPTAVALGSHLDRRERHSVAIRRAALRDHGHRARLEEVLAALGVPRRPPPRISVLLATRRPERLLSAAAQVDAQDHPDVELVAALHGDGFGDDAATRLAAAVSVPVRVARVPAAAPLGDVCNAGLDLATGEQIAKMDDDDLYGTGHLSDLAVALDYSGADVVGRRANEVYLVDDDVTVAQDLDRQERWATHLPGATLLAQGDALRAVRFRRVSRGIDTHLLRSIHAAGGSAYATHRFGFVRQRHGGGHTYARDVEAGHDPPREGLDSSVLEV